MKLMLIYIILAVVVCNCAMILAYPSSYSIDRIDRDVRDLKYVDSVYNYKNSRLRRAYFYDDDDDDDTFDYYPYETERIVIRKQDTDAEDLEYKYTPLVRYRAAHTERKKLFVPNVWG